MTDLALTAGWLAVLCAGLSACALLRRLGVPRTFVRDLLHVSTAVWVLGWPLWQAPWAPAILVISAALAAAAAPRWSRRSRLAARVVESVSDRDERWTGVTAYVAAYAIFTLLGLFVAPIPAAIGLLALSFGDGGGGAIGKHFGRLHYRMPWAKTKTLEGSFAVWGISAIAAWVGAKYFALSLPIAAAVTIGFAAAAAEALAPKSSDNLLVPAAAALASAVWVT